MTAEMDSGLIVDSYNFAVLCDVAAQSDQSLEDFVNGSATLGLELAEVVLSEAPEPLSIGFEASRCDEKNERHYALYPLNFTGHIVEPVPVPEDLQALDKRLQHEAAKHAVPLYDELLHKVTDIAMLLCVDRAAFLQTSIFFYNEWGQTVARGGDVVLRDAQERYVIIGEPIEED